MTEVVANTETVQADPDAAKWQELAKELEDEGAGGGEPEPQPEPELKAEPEKAEDEQQDAKPEHVPYSQFENLQKALAEERRLRQQSSEQLHSITQLIQQLRESRQQPKQEADAPKPPSLDEDPIGYFKWENEQLRKQIDEIKTGSTKSVEQVQAQLQEQQFWNTVIRSEQEIRLKVPDYDDATSFLEQSRIAELEFMVPDDDRGRALAQQYGFQTPAELRAAMLNQDRIAVAQQALTLGMSPAQFYYDLAKRRGYQPKAANGNGTQPGGKPNGQQMIEMARRGQKAAKTLSGGTNGSGPDHPLNINDLIDLYSEDPEEFDKQFEKLARQGLLG